MDKPRNYLVSNVILNWARLDQPVSPFGTPQWELQMEVSDEQAKELSAQHFNVKMKDGKNTVSLKRKAVKADGSPMDPVRVVGADKMPLDASSRSKIGNGSKGNVIVWQAPYTAAGRSGISNSLTAVQVTEMVEYVSTGGVDFDVVSSEAPEAPSADLF